MPLDKDDLKKLGRMLLGSGIVSAALIHNHYAKSRKIEREARRRLANEDTDRNIELEVRRQLAARMAGAREPFDNLRRRVRDSKLRSIEKTKAAEILGEMECSAAVGDSVGRANQYVEWLLRYPWESEAVIERSLSDIRTSLLHDFFGNEQVVDLVSDFVISSRMLGSSANAMRVCFIGPPGTGKTYIARSIAKALDRPFAFATMAGASDATWILGIPRHYLGSQPGRIVRGICEAGIKNPVFILDEVDKVSHNPLVGSPSEALLDALDPDNADLFEDHYLEVQVDIRCVSFICCANNIERLHPTFSDRLQIIEFGPYSPEDKRKIILGYLWPRIIDAYGMDYSKVVLSEQVLDHLAHYSEPGMRQVDRELKAMAASTLKGFYLQYYDGKPTQDVNPLALKSLELVIDLKKELIS